MRAEIDIPDALGAHALDAALEGLVELGTAELTSHSVNGPPIPPLYESGVRYEREEGSERWLTPTQVLALGVGDCEDLASWRAAELRVSGEDPSARATVIRSGPRTWHAIVSRENGDYIEDPSSVLGMGSEPEGSLVGWSMRCSRVPGGYQCTLTRDGAGVVGYGPTRTAAIARATDTGSVGQIPGLDILANIARGALNAALPSTSAPSTSPIARSAVPYTSPVSMPTGDVSAEVSRIARQISALTSREARRKLTAAQRAVRGR